MTKKQLFLLFLFLLFIFRTGYGLITEFWEPDEFNIYLLGFDFYTSGSWPYFGPYVVYNCYHIPGALQAILTGGPLFLFPVPESSFIFLSVLTFSALCLLCWYIEKRIPGLPRWFIWGLVMTLPWSVQFGTRIINPSYLLVFSILFFVSFFELLPLYKQKLIPPWLSCFMMGFSVTCSMQIHLSWVLLIPFVITTLIFRIYDRSLRIKDTGIFVLGAVTGMLTLIPTLLVYGFSVYKGASFYFEFQIEGILNFFTILLRFLSYSTYEVLYFMGIPCDHFREIRQSPWMTPFTAVVLVFGYIQLIFFIISFFLKRNQADWKFIKWISFFSVVLVFVYFLFSRKGPSSHTFYILYPLSLFYSMYCYQYIFPVHRYLKTVLFIVLFSGTVFLAGLGCYKYSHYSLYLNRALVKKAIETKDYKLLVDKKEKSRD
ncbi:MAG: hypothetical protein NTY96_13415 [Bacteroidetes bacterium]|nr:hypothetical protein [Bacteroidota bacterium]